MQLGVLLIACNLFPLLLLLSKCCPSEAARLLVIPLASDSHIAAFTALTTQLEMLGGHEIHMVRGLLHAMLLGVFHGCQCTCAHMRSEEEEEEEGAFCTRHVVA